ncbi:Hypothetical protein CINCED_3A024424 [Cinara cedri]|uniref:Uncharacterized protein n=1 Tax=Cinara cedri TaxID=506608 RepID=A0A5E4NMF4_9HEMI|nr:Hypothetical protein CINCED_3A024424 [Cinara cedri]
MENYVIARYRKKLIDRRTLAVLIDSEETYYEATRMYGAAGHYLMYLLDKSKSWHLLGSKEWCASEYPS